MGTRVKQLDFERIRENDAERCPYCGTEVKIDVALIGVSIDENPCNAGSFSGCEREAGSRLCHSLEGNAFAGVHAIDRADFTNRNAFRQKNSPGTVQCRKVKGYDITST